MWWDIMPVYGGPVPQDRAALHRAALETMAAILKFDSVACQESALHGLGHWRSDFPAEIESLIDEFLRLNPDARPELRTYARAEPAAAAYCSVVHCEERQRRKRSSALRVAVLEHFRTPAPECYSLA